MLLKNTNITLVKVTRKVGIEDTCTSLLLFKRVYEQTGGIEILYCMLGLEWSIKSVTLQKHPQIDK